MKNVSAGKKARTTDGATEYQNQWWVALGLAGLIVLMQFYDRARPVYDSWSSAPTQAKKK